MEVIGRGYLIEHSMAALRRIRKRERLENYIADALFAISNNLSLIDKYRDLEERNKKEGKPEASAEDIKNRIRGKLQGG